MNILFLGNVSSEIKGVLDRSLTDEGTVTVIDCRSTDRAVIFDSINGRSPVVLCHATPDVRHLIHELAGVSTSDRAEFIGIRKIESGFNVLDEVGLASSGSVSGSEEASEAASVTQVEGLASLTAALQPAPKRTLLRAGDGRYFPGQGASYWTGQNRWRREFKIGNTNDINVVKGYNDSVAEQTLTLDVSADLHVYYSERSRSYTFFVKYRIESSPGRALVNSGHSRGYFLTKLFADFQLETSCGTVTPLSHVPRVLNASEPFNREIPLERHEMILAVDTDRGRADIPFAPSDSVICDISGWAIKDRSSGPRVSLEMHQKSAWDVTTEPREKFGDWWRAIYEYRPHDSGHNEPQDFVRRMPETSWNTISTQAIAAWRLTETPGSPLPAKRDDVWITLRPMGGGFRQEAAFIHQRSACFQGTNHLFWLDQQISDAWGLHLSWLQGGGN